jgi:hypothetical protein
MKYLIVEPKVKAIAPNIALMKWARWCENEGHQYQYVRGKVKPDFIPDKILMSCIFTYYSKRYEETINYYIKIFPNVKILVGGVFPTLYPKWFEKWNVRFLDLISVTTHQGTSCEIENLIPKYNVEIISEDENPYPRNKIVLYSSRGCVNKCAYCAVPKLEGAMKSFRSIKETLELAKEEVPDANSVVLYDNNFTEHEYFDDIVDELLEFGLPIDIHGLHVESFTEHHAKRLSELEWKPQSDTGTAYIRFSFDKMKYANSVENALHLVNKYNIKAQFFAYMLFNFTDSPQDFWWRIEKAQEMVDKIGRTIYLFPQRYEPFKALERNKFIGPKWTDELVRGLVKLYTSIHGFIPITKSHNIYKWIGNDYEEFLEKIKKSLT